jgi:hypothetical protein
LPGACWQIADEPLHASVVQTLPSSGQGVPLDLNPLAGQVVELPEQLAARSQASAAARHWVPGLPAGCWQVTFVPSHWSFVQALPSSVQGVPLPFFTSAGQPADVPVQFSARSHSPAGDLQTVLDDLKPSAGQVTTVPLQVSATSQVPAEARQTVPLARGVQVPRCPARLHASQVPVLHAVSQQIPFTQNADAHWLFEEHPRPKLAS